MTDLEKAMARVGRLLNERNLNREPLSPTEDNWLEVLRNRADWLKRFGHRIERD